jgi:hypothetical protein
MIGSAQDAKRRSVRPCMVVVLTLTSQKYMSDARLVVERRDDSTAKYDPERRSCCTFRWPAGGGPWTWELSMHLTIKVDVREGPAYRHRTTASFPPSIHSASTRGHPHTDNRLGSHRHSAQCMRKVCTLGALCANCAIIGGLKRKHYCWGTGSAT